jgi:hypothetical protein
MKNSHSQNCHQEFSAPRIALVLLITLLAACKHPLEIEGAGDIVERNNGVRGCALEEFQAGFGRCTNNEIFQDETALYQALSRPGWSFSHWDGACAKDSPAPDCKLEYSADWAQLWDDNYPDLAGPPLTAVFIEDSDSPGGTNYIASSFGITDIGDGTYSALLDALFSTDNSYRYTALQASTRSSFDRSLSYYQLQPSGLLLTGADPARLDVGGASTAVGDLLTLVDTDADDNEISVAYLMPKRNGATSAEFSGLYYCGHIATDGVARFSRITASGNGGGVFQVIQDRKGASGQTAAVYAVLDDGTMTLDYAGVHLVGSLSVDGSVFVSSQLQRSAHGAAVCVRASSGNSLGTMAGEWLGSWISTGLTTAVTELLVRSSGLTAESVYVDSTGRRDYVLGTDSMLVKWDGNFSTREQYGAVSPDGRIAFAVNTEPSKYPTLILYIRKGA